MIQPNIRECVLTYLSDGEWHLSKDILASTGVSRDDIRAAGMLSDGT